MGKGRFNRHPTQLKKKHERRKNKKGKYLCNSDDEDDNFMSLSGRGSQKGAPKMMTFADLEKLQSNSGSAPKNSIAESSTNTGSTYNPKRKKAVIDSDEEDDMSDGLYDDILKNSDSFFDELLIAKFAKGKGDWVEAQQDDNLILDPSLLLDITSSEEEDVNGQIKRKKIRKSQRKRISNNDGTPSRKVKKRHQTVLTGPISQEEARSLQSWVSVSYDEDLIINESKTHITVKVKKTEIVSGHKAISTENIGNKMLQAMGWSPGTGLGKKMDGIVDPVTAIQRPRRQGLGHE